MQSSPTKLCRISKEFLVLKTVNTHLKAMNILNNYP